MLIHSVTVRRLLLICGLLTVSSPDAAVAQDRQGSGLPETVSLPADLDAVLRAYETAWAARDAEALTALFTEDGFVLRPGYPPAHGRAAIREAYANSGGPLTLRAYSFGESGDVGYIIGGYTSDPARLETGKFVLALRRGGSGGWLIAADMDNGN